MVASTHWLATGAGFSVLERGGNAFDAAVAAGFVLQIVEPHLNGPGGDSAIIVWSREDGRPYVVCGQGPSPAAATLAHFTDLGLGLVPGSGPLAATVPGAFGAWTTLLQRWGTWELADALGYALHYAEHGFPVLATISNRIAAVRNLFVEHWTPSAATWLDAGQAPAAGTWWRSPVVAQTYRRLIAESVGPSREARIAAANDAWYDGFVAEAISEFSAHEWRDTSGRDHRGVLTAHDLAGWQAQVEEPISVDVAGRYQLLKTGPWGQGPVLAQQLRLLEACGIAELPARSVRWVHTVVEAAKLAFADREAYYGDPVDQVVPIETLLSRAYAVERAALIGESADLDLRPGRPDGREPRLATIVSTSPAPSDVGFDRTARGSAGEPTVGQDGENRGDTCHVDVVDRWGNFVSATPSGGWLQSSPVVESLGFPLGTRGQMFYLEAGLPNALRPGVRPRTTLTPSLALRDGEPWLAFGTPGGDQQDQWQTTFFLDVLAADGEDRLNLQEAIDAPTFNTSHFPSSFYPRTAYPGQLAVESRLDPDVVAGLRARGHDVVLSGPWTQGRISAVAKEGETMRGAANARGDQGYAMGR
jgi:gamma-glutamyltranspeptidase/glutathione hydrolase